MNYRHTLIIFVLGILVITPAFAQEEGTNLTDTSRYFAASLAFTAAALAAGYAISKAGSAGLAATAERPEMRTTAIIITALGEAIAIYGIVVAILILGG